MKKTIIILAITLVGFGSISLTSCSDSQTQKKAEKTEKVAQAEYQCPMHCEGDKVYDKPGKCPVCGMNLKAVHKNAKAGHEGHNHN